MRQNVNDLQSCDFFGKRLAAELCISMVLYVQLLYSILAIHLGD